MLTRPQKALLKRAQRECGLEDGEYREALELVAGCRSSTDPRMTDRHLDQLLAYMEAIYWRGLDAGKLQPPCSANAVFKKRDYWKSKNPSTETSRDRYNGRNQGDEIEALESLLAAIGCGAAYCSAIRANVCKGRSDAHSLHLYQAALARTLHAKVIKEAGCDLPASTLMRYAPEDLRQLVEFLSGPEPPENPF